MCSIEGCLVSLILGGRLIRVCITQFGYRYHATLESALSEMYSSGVVSHNACHHREYAARACSSVMDIVYTSHILLIHFITTRTFDIESLYHSTYFLNISFNTAFYHLKTQKLLSYLLCSIYYIFATLE